MCDYFSDKPGTWMHYMRKGEFEEAWKISDGILRSGLNRDYNNLPRHFQCIWDGTTLKGKNVLIRCYHGMGDTIQFIRYAPLVREIASRVIIWIQPRLIELLRNVQGIDQLLPLHDGVPDADYDTDVEIMELPYIFRTTLAEIPLNIPYINIKPAAIPGTEGHVTVGLVWQAGDWDTKRSVPFQLLKALGSIKNAAFIILQDRAEQAGWSGDFGIHPGNCSLLDHARIIRSLDLMITIDSMPAHLAGALNTPVWLMLNADSDWRWMEDRIDSPWYPSMRLFRQGSEGRWEVVLERIYTELESFVAIKQSLTK